MSDFGRLNSLEPYNTFVLNKFPLTLNLIVEPEAKEEILMKGETVIKDENIYKSKKGKVETNSKKMKKFSRSFKGLSDPSLNFSCDKCQVRFKRSSSLKKHELVEQQIKISCEECTSIFMDFKVYQKHTQIHRTFICVECGEICSSKSQLNSHEYKMHDKGDKDKPCPYCAKQVYNLKAHIQGSHEAELIVCSKCDYRTRNKQSFTDHSNNVHKEAVMKTCQFCGGSYKRVDRHIQVMNCGQAKRIRSKCDQCDKTFALKQTLRKHIKIVHLQIRNKTCLYCDYKTYTKFNLDLHMNKMHLGIQMEKQNCSHCDKSTYKLEHHMKVYHGELYSQ